MRHRNVINAVAPIILMLTLNVAGLFAQNTVPGAALEAASVVKELNLPKGKADEALKVVNAFVAGVQDSSRQYAALLQQKAGDLFDPQFLTKVEQIKKGLALKIERFTLDLSDIAGETIADAVAARYRAAIPQVLLASQSTPAAGSTHAAPAPQGNVPEVPLGSPMPGMPGMNSGPAAGTVPEVALGTDSSLDLSIQGGSAKSGGMGMMDMMSSMMGGMMGGMMSGMGGSSSMTPDPVIAQLAAQLASINGLIERMIQAVSIPGGGTESQLTVLTQLLANQRSLIELLASRAGSSTGSMAPMGMM